MSDIYEDFQTFWVHASFSRDLQTLGYQPTAYGRGPWDSYMLRVKDWRAFLSLYDEKPKLYAENPDQLTL